MWDSENTIHISIPYWESCFLQKEKESCFFVFFLFF